MHSGFVVGATAVVITKLVPAVRADTHSRLIVVLQVTPSLVPSESSFVSMIWLLAVTAEVFTVTVVAPAAITTEPAAADPHAAGAAEDEQFVCVAYKLE
jgi:hypothetical protein